MNPSADQLKILTTLSVTGGTGNVMQILNYGVSRFEEGFAVANEMQNMNYVKLLYSNFNKNLIVVELTLWGESKATNF